MGRLRFVSRRRVIGFLDAGPIRRIVPELLAERAAEVTALRAVDRYFNIAIQLGLPVARGLQLALVGQSLLAAQRAEFSPEFLNLRRAESQRGVYPSLNWSSNER